MHRAEEIITAIELALTGLATTGSRVYRSRVRSIEDAPALAVEMGADDVSVDASNYPQVARELNVKIIAFVKNNTSFDSDLNAIRAEVFEALMTDPTLALSFVTDTMLISDNEPEFSGEGDQITGKQQMDYVVKYRHSWNSTEA